MIVVADTSPLNYLIRMRLVEILELLYGRILVPHAVLDEMLSGKAPDAVSSWARNPPHWVEILSPSTTLTKSIHDLDPGETEAIALAIEVRADWLLIDDAEGRLKANDRGLKTIGTLGVLRDGHRIGLLDLRSRLAELQALGFHVAQSLVDQLLSSV